MASSRPYEPVLHCRKDRPKEVYRLALRLLKGLYAHPAEFPDPWIAKTTFETETKALKELLRYERGDSKAIKLCLVKSFQVHAFCKMLLSFVTPICGGDIEMIQMTGFEVNRMPRKHQHPRQPVILKIVKAGGQFRYKIILAKMQTGNNVDPDPATHQRDVRYTIELSLNQDDEKSWNKVCVSAASTKLFFEDVFPGQKNYVRVYGTNAAGDGQCSLVRYFTPDIP